MAIRQNGKRALFVGALLGTILTAGTAQARPAVERIVFIDKQNACPCTRKQIDAIWALLQKVLAGRKLPVDRISLDQRPADAQRYRAKRAFLALPAIYFLGSGDRLIELLQGEIKETWIRKVLR
jgi:hypothetical protein